MLGLGTSLSSLYIPQGSSYTNAYSVSFDGVDDFIDLNAPSNWESILRNSFSISTWIKMPPASASGNQWLFSVKDSSQDLIRWYYSSGSLKIRHESDNVFDDITVTLAAETWFNFVYTVEKTGTGSELTQHVLYVNGSATGTHTSGGGGGAMTAADQGALDIASGDNFKLGGYTSARGRFTMHDFAIYQDVLTADNAVAVYNSGTSIDLGTNSGNYDKSDRLVYYYKLDEGENDIATDSAGSNNGTLTNGPSWVTDVPS